MSGVFECFHCGARAVIWDADFTAEEYGYEEDGIVHNLHCGNCGAEIIYVLLDNEETEQDAGGEQEESREQAKAHWRQDSRDPEWYSCSRCGILEHIGKQAVDLWRYCPHCGASMEGAG